MGTYKFVACCHQQVIRLENDVFPIVPLDRHIISTQSGDTAFQNAYITTTHAVEVPRRLYMKSSGEGY